VYATTAPGLTAYLGREDYATPYGPLVPIPVSAVRLLLNAGF